MNKTRYDYNFLINYCNENNIELLKDYKNIKLNREIIIKAKCIYNNCNNIVNKNFRCLIDYGCYCGSCQKIISQEKRKQTNLEKFGVEYPLQNEEIKEKIKKTNLEKFGVENPLQNEEIKEKIKKTNLEKFGVEYPLQNEEIREKQEKNSYKLKDFILPSGKIIQTQGYENFALNELINDENIDEEEIITGSKNVPIIWYYKNNKKHRHYVDIFIKSQNRCIEIKSTWTKLKNLNNIYLKQEAGKNLGYNYEIWVYNQKGEKIECYK